MSGATVRQANLADVRLAAALRWAWVMEEQAGSSSLSRDDFIAEFVDWADQHAATHQCFVAEVEGAVVGMAWLAVTDRVPSPRSLNRRTAGIQSVYVSPELRNQGIGSLLIEAVVRAAASSGAERLTVHSSPGAVSAYDRAGLKASELLRSRDLNIPK
ncbi:GNAT family N-acetyltransferase [Naasia lichenicola]|uniref:GNAT family N-acetyltransferase n=1 Tax=Naasia lichenicola TaxID=2565933 RepID=A0A4S4FPM6_9MICO|nr:GNAT family N-acetyltransferase [Naasia lichenicola]THG31525.1 GNAT family N-acetyltransferase [Naasia lichenicola]